LHRGGVFDKSGCRFLHLGFLAEPCGADHHDHLLPDHHLPQTEIHSQVLLGCFDHLHLYQSFH
ncbi:unnamed protein product, partial [Tetraodon nigroviridis]